MKVGAVLSGIPKGTISTHGIFDNAGFFRLLEGSINFCIHVPYKCIKLFFVRDPIRCSDGFPMSNPLQVHLRQRF